MTTFKELVQLQAEYLDRRLAYEAILRRDGIAVAQSTPEWRECRAAFRRVQVAAEGLDRGRAARTTPRHGLEGMKS